MSESSGFGSLSRSIDGAVSRVVQGLVTPSRASSAERIAALAQYRIAREGTRSIIAGLSQAQADFKPSRGAWSIGQNVEHLLLTEDLYRDQIQTLIQMARRGRETNLDLTFREINTSLAYVPREVISLFSAPMKIMNIFIPQPVREIMFRNPLIPAIAPTVSIPSGSKPIDELRLRCETSFAATEAVFRGDLPPNLDRMTMTHPMLGTNNMAQIFRIIAAHEERHQRQIRSVLSNPRFPRR